MKRWIRRTGLAACRAAAAAAAFAFAASCGGGGGGSPTSSSYPAIKGVYGSYTSLASGVSRQKWTAPDGTVTNVECIAVTSIPVQNGASFSGSVDRVVPCGSQATIVGTIAQDSTFEFTLTQARWGSCTAVGNGQYKGVVNLGSLLATGRVTVACDDGRTMTIDEQITGNLPVPPSTN